MVYYHAKSKTFWPNYLWNEKLIAKTSCKYSSDLKKKKEIILAARDVEDFCCGRYYCGLEFRVCMRIGYRKRNFQRLTRIIIKLQSRVRKSILFRESHRRIWASTYKTRTFPLGYYINFYTCIVPRDFH